MIYLEAQLTVEHGKMDEFMEIFEKVIVPESTKMNRILIGQWRTSIGTLGEITNLWSYEDLAAMQRFNESRAKNPTLSKAFERLTACVSHETLKLMVPTKASPLK
jgi:hypothetical protein